MDALRVEGLSKRYPGFELEDVTFTLPEGAIMGFIGENGAGKTTTLKALLGLIHPDGGQVDILGQPFSANERGCKEQLGVVFDECCFHDNLALRDIDRIMGRIYRSWDPALFRAYARQLDLPEGKTVKQYSKGMKMKLNIAAALGHRPRLLILDEPTSGLDPVMREELLDLFQAFIQDDQHSILLSSHITSDLDKIADYITFIHQGRLLFSQPKDELLDTMGVLKCGAATFEAMDAQEILRYRKSQFGYEVLLPDRRRYLARHPGSLVDPATVEEMMLFYVRGERK